MAQEIERKFLVTALPDEVRQQKKKIIEQGYLALEPDGYEVRLRRIGPAYFLTAKSDGTIQRQEYEVALTEAQFAELWPATEGRRLKKDRYLLDRGTHKIEIDVYHQPLQGLMVAEVEFDSLTAAEHYRQEDWMSKEVTHLSFLKNKNLLQFEHFEAILHLV